MFTIQRSYTFSYIYDFCRHQIVFTCHKSAPHSFSQLLSSVSIPQMSWYHDSSLRSLGAAAVMICCTQSMINVHAFFSLSSLLFFFSFSPFPSSLLQHERGQQGDNKKMGCHDELQPHRFMVSASALATLVQQENMLRIRADGEGMQEGGKLGEMLRQGICSFRDQPCYSESLVFPRNCGLELSKVPRVNSLEGDAPMYLWIKRQFLSWTTVTFINVAGTNGTQIENWKENFIYKSYPDTDLFGFVWKRTWWNINIHSINIY